MEAQQGCLLLAASKARRCQGQEVSLLCLAMLGVLECLTSYNTGGPTNGHPRLTRVKGSNGIVTCVSDALLGVTRKLQSSHEARE